MRAVAVLLVAARALAAEPSLIALTDTGRLLVLPADRPEASRSLDLGGVGGRLIGLDVRPADGTLYGLTDASDLHRIDVDAGRAELVASLTIPFDGDARSGVDFTPLADRLRLLGWDGQNLRVHPTLGAAALDRPLVWKPGDPNAGRQPRITAAAYSRNLPGDPDTKLLAIDAERDVLALVDPPNDGLLATIGPLGVDFGPEGGFDILTSEGRDRAWAASGTVLYAVDLDTGRAGRIGDLPASAISLAVLPQ